MTTKVKKKGVWAYQEAPQRKSRADCRSGSRGDSLPFKSTNPLQETEKCCWPKLNLAVPSSHKNPAACNNLDFGTQRKVSFISCKDLDRWWSLLRGLLCLLQDWCTFAASGRVMRHREEISPGLQGSFQVVGARCHSELLLGSVDALIGKDI